MAFFFGGFSWWFCPGETAHELAERTWLLSVVECVCRWCWDASPFPGVWVGKPPLRIRCDGNGRERERGCTWGQMVNVMAEWGCITALAKELLEAKTCVVCQT